MYKQKTTVYTHGKYSTWAMNIEYDMLDFESYMNYLNKNKPEWDEIEVGKMLYEANESVKLEKKGTITVKRFLDPNRKYTVARKQEDGK